jgi:hypothetical protein
MLPLSLKRSGRLALRSIALAAFVGVVLSGCYQFTGGGLPPHVRTIAILPFENETAQAMLTPQLQQQLQQELQRKLGVRLASEATADAIVRGRITDYIEAEPGVRPGAPGAPGGAGRDRPEVFERRVEIAVAIEIYDVREDRILWQSSSLRGAGRINPERQQITQGVELALRDIASKVVDGAQSQW